MSLFSQFATDRRAEVEGIDVTFDGVTKFRVSRMGRSNKRYQKMVEAETKVHRHAIQNETFPTELDEAITLKIFIACILLGWEKLRMPELFTPDEHCVPADDGGSYLPCTPENAARLFGKDGLPELYIALKEQAQKMANFRAEDIAEDSKT
jgi:hypothetical protein